MSVVRAAEIDRFLRGLRERQAAARSRDPLARDGVLFRSTAVRLRSNLLQLRDRVGGRRVRRARVSVRRLAAARYAAPRQILTRVAPREIDLLPRHADHFGGDAVHVAHRLGAEIPYAGLDVHATVGLDDEQAV